MTIKRIHVIFNAHIDPIWLWPWPSGLDEVLNTCESMCNLLDCNPDVVFTRGEAWAYEQVERMAPALFQRIKEHIRAGRWEVVGGWYVQPDCNLPEENGFRKQIELGRSYFQEKLGCFPDTAYNVDSFGHTSLLPDLMGEAGQKHYVMMRPQEHEMKLPARLFRWRGRRGGAEIVTFRIAGAYGHCNPGNPDMHAALEQCVSELPPGVNDTMFFAGVGDHGGGPTRELIEWFRANRGIVPGARLEFSSPARYFRAVEHHTPRLPLVTGELQMHAIGCYSVHRAVKIGVRRAEHLLAQAEEAMKLDPVAAKTSAGELDSAWRKVCFNHFHDTLGGTCIPSAYDQVDAQLGFARAVADGILQSFFRRRTADLGADECQRLVLGNFSGHDFHGWVEHEPWLSGLGWLHCADWNPEWSLADESGREIPYQRLEPEAVGVWKIPRLLFKIKIAASGLRTLRIAARSGKPPVDLKAGSFALKKNAGDTLGAIADGRRWPMPELQLVEDASDTWSHGCHSYGGKQAGAAKWNRITMLEAGPLRHAWLADGCIGKSPLAAEWRRYAGEPFFELRLRVCWLEEHRVLRLNWRPGGVIAFRDDGVAGGGLRRESDGRERPVRDRTLLCLEGGLKAGAIFPDTFSLSGTRRDLRLTLLRSAIMAHHEPGSAFDHKRRVISDRGEQSFVFRFYPPGTATAPRLDRDALALHRPPVVSDVTRGMPGDTRP